MVPCQPTYGAVPMSPDDPGHSVTAWIAGLKNGDQDAASPLWERYFHQLAKVARVRLGNTSKRSFDDEDVALSVLDSVCRGAAEGKFRQLSDRHELWLLLLAITRQKSIDRLRAAGAQKRGAGLERGESVFGDQDALGLQAIV